MLKPSIVRAAASLFVAAGVAFAQSNPISFEVASIKPSGPLDPVAIVSGKAHIGMRVDNDQVDIGSMSLLQLICDAYKVKPFQVAGTPDFAATARFDIAAKLPDGSSKDQVPQMLQALLAERFHLSVHHDNKEQPVYALVVGKSGPKLKEALPEPPAAPATPPAPSKGEIVLGSGDGQVRIQRSSNGEMAVNSKQTGPMRVSIDNGTIHMEFEQMTMAALADTLAQYLDRPVIDMTELKGAYQVSLQLALADAMSLAGKMGVPVPALPPRAANFGNSPVVTAPDPSGGSLFTSVQQLGLKLESRKMPYDLLVIDHLEKTPTEN